MLLPFIPKEAAAYEIQNLLPGPEIVFGHVLNRCIIP
jgi:hypothetical protein